MFTTINIQDFLISPPFGNYIRRSDCTRIRGSYTAERRSGLIIQTLRTLRKVPGGWINNIGLRNKGIAAVNFKWDCIYSVVGLRPNDWNIIYMYLPYGMVIEVNLGCQNTEPYGIKPGILRMYCEHNPVIVKLPVGNLSDTYDLAGMCMDAGVKYLHLSNTVPVMHGSISGQLLFEHNLPVVNLLASRYPGQIIAGGGIYTPEHLQSYYDAGASKFSLATVWFTPWRVNAIMRHWDTIKPR